MGRMSREKGARGEREVIDQLHAHGWPHAHRNFASGSRGGSDIARGPAGVALEIKRTEALRLRDTWKQATEDAAQRGDVPVIAHRWNGGEWLAVLPLDELLALLAHRERA